MKLKNILEISTINKTDLRHLVSGILNFPPSDLILHLEKKLSNFEISSIQKAITNVKNGSPVYRVLGWREFYGRRFFLNDSTLEPRPDSEILIDQIKADFPAEMALSVLDLGTGTGCLLSTILSEFQNAKGVGIDISNEAISCAKKNAKNLNLEKRISFFQDDILYLKLNKKFDIIVSNPTYIKTDDVFKLEKNVKDFDPILALDGGKTGLVFYEKIARIYKKLLNPNGKLYLEIGFDQAESVANLFEKSKLILDYNKNPRVIVV